MGSFVVWKILRDIQERENMERDEKGDRRGEGRKKDQKIDKNEGIEMKRGRKIGEKR